MCSSDLESRSRSTHAISWSRAWATASWNGAAWVKVVNSLASRRDRLIEGLETLGLAVHRPQGTYFVQADVRPLGIDDAGVLARSLPAEGGVVAIPTGVFCDHDDVGRPFLRFAFCKQEAVLDEAVRRLTAFASRRKRSS